MGLGSSQSFSRRRHPLLLLTLCVGLAASGPAGAADTAAGIDAVVERAMQTFNVPGMAVSVVHDDEVIHAAGYGVAEVGKRKKVDADTLFQIASVSKAFTAASLALLVDDGLLDWDDPVIDYLPEFRMYDPWVTREFTVRDLLTHRSGLPLGAGDLLLFPETNTTRDEVVRALRHLKPSSSFRSEYAYDNLLYIVAGELVAAVAGVPFEEFVEQRLLFPLGMQDCRSMLDRVPAKADRATPHVYRDGVFAVTNSLESPLAAAAGGINCSARSMARWLSLFLHGGLGPDGSRIISEAQVQELLKPVTLVTPPAYMREHAGSSLGAYALGWNVSTFHGQPIYSHSGGLWGMTSFVAILPAQRLAVFASNNQMSVAPRAVVMDILEHFPGAGTTTARQDWIAIFEEAINARRTSAADTVSAAQAARDAQSTPSLPLEALAGTYRDPWYGDIQIELREDGRLWFTSARSTALEGPLEHFQFNTFIARWLRRELNADAYVSFVLSPEGGIERIRMKAVSPLTDFSFDFHDLDLTRVTTEHEPPSG